MKKFIALFAIAALAVSAQAAQINWGSQGVVYNGAEKMTTANGYTMTAYLVYLGTAAEGASWATSAFDPTAAVAVGGDVLAGPNPGSIPGTVSLTGASYGFTDGAAVGAGAGTMTSGQSTFGIIFLASGGGFAAQQHYFLSSTFVYDTLDVTTPGVWTPVNSTYSYGATVGTGSVWTPVPEPATAALAIAGLAMLIRRRK